jgi:hypothetical protein
MKTILILCGLVLAGAIAWLVIARPFADHFGSSFRGLGSVQVAQLLDKPSDFVKKDVRIDGVVTRQCPNCGCWFVVRDSGSRELRVEMGETAGHLPFRLGKAVTVEGQLIKFGEEVEFIGTAVEFH